jgi:hypothetical protein
MTQKLASFSTQLRLLESMISTFQLGFHFHLGLLWLHQQLWHLLPPALPSAKRLLYWLSSICAGHCFTPKCTSCIGKLALVLLKQQHMKACESRLLYNSQCNGMHSAEQRARADNITSHMLCILSQIAYSFIQRMFPVYDCRTYTRRTLRSSL